MNHSLLRIELQVPKLEASIEHAVAVLGMEALDHTTESASLALPGQPASMLLTAGDGAALSAVAFVTAAENLTAIRDRAEQCDCEYEPVEAGLNLVAPNGLLVQFLALVRPPRNTAARGTGPVIAGLDHVGLCARELDATVAFFRDVLGFRVSDSVENKRHWLRCGPSHHQVAVFEGDDVLQHYAFATPAFDQIQKLGDLLATREQNFIWGPGRHNLGANTFTYHLDPAGAVLEICSDMIEVPDEAAWVTQVWPADTLASALMWGPPPPPEFRALGIPIVNRARAPA